MKRYVLYFVTSIILSLCLCVIFSVDRKAAAAVAGDVKIDAVNFPDPYVRATIKEKDSDKNGVLSQEEINKVKKLSIVAQNEKTEEKYSVNLHGISIFTNIADINVAGTTIEHEEELLSLPHIEKLGLSYDCKMSKLDMGKFSNIKSLFLYATEVNEIDLSKNTNLEKLDIYIPHTQNMKQLDLSNNKNLTFLELATDNPDKVLVGSAINLSKFVLWMYRSGSVNIENLSSLKEFNLKSSHKLEELHIKNCPLLEKVEVANSDKLKSITFEQVPNLKRYYVTAKNLKNIDVGALKSLIAIRAEVKNLENVSLPTENLKSISITSRKIKGMDLSSTTKLDYLMLDTPKLEKLLLSKKSIVSVLEIVNSSLKKINLPNSKKLWLLQLHSTKMKSVSLSPLKNVKQMVIGLDKAKKMTIPNLKKLKTLTLRKMPKLKQLKMPKKKKWERVDLYKCKSLQVPMKSLTNVKELCVQGNRKVKTLNLTKFKRLYDFEWSDGVLKKIIWGKGKKIGYINVNSNKLSGCWDLRKNLSGVSEIRCYNNRLTTIIGGKYNALLYCEKNKLKKVDMRATKNLCVLSCVKNKGVRVYMPTELEDGPNVDRSAKVIYKK